MIETEAILDKNTSPKMWILVLEKEVVDEYSLSPGQRYIGRIGKLEWNCGLLTYGSGSLYIMFGEKKRKIAELPDEIGYKLKLKLEKDNSKYGVPMPEEFQAMLDMDPNFDKKFHAQSQSFQRTVINFIGKYKSEAKRMEHGTRLMRNILNYPSDKVDIGAVMREK